MNRESCFVLLHGWGLDKSSFKKLIPLLGNLGEVFVFDLPGFGDEPEPREVWGSEDYAQFIKKKLSDLGPKKAIVIGHSFGGRVAIKMAAEYPDLIEKLILINSSGLRKKFSFKRVLGKFNHCLGKTLLLFGIQGKRLKKRLFNKFGSQDFLKTKGIMRSVLIKVLQEDLSPSLREINCSTLLIWSQQDQETPLWMGQKMDRLIPQSQLVILPDANHLDPLFSRASQTAYQIKKFLKPKQAP